MPGTAVDITIMDYSIFEAFPNAIISGVWSLGTCQHGTVVGNQFNKIADIDVIIDDGASSNVNNTPETLVYDILVYAIPCQIPVAVTNFRPHKIGTGATVSAYMLYNNEEDAYYEIVDAGIGKNQHTGKVEHIELKLLRTEVVLDA